MATIIWKEPKPQGTAKSRYKARRAAKVAERRDDEALGRKVAVIASGCSNKVQKAVSSTDYKMKMRRKPVPEGVTRENLEYRKVNNPYSQLTNARQKMRGKSIPLI
ncbi:regulator [Erwinia billingiae]|uniref:regulator n=1 Tax=Erwinia billingiae TaxID=182337 RepID=UPI0030D5F065